MDKKEVSKKERLLAALDKGLVLIRLDARRPGVLVPPKLRNEPDLPLNLSYRFDPPDLTVGEWGVRSTLSFSGSRFTVAVPWSAVFVILSHVTKECWMYPDAFPSEILRTLDPMLAPPGDGEPKGSAKALLREVATEPQPPKEPAAAEEPSEETPTPRRRGHLRVVK